MKIYISGKISGMNINEAREHFAKVESNLRSKGNDVVNPFNNGLKVTDPWERHIARDIKNLLECDKVFLLSGWENSRGARIEVELCKELNIPIETEKDS